MGDINRQKKTASHVFLLRYTHAHFCVHIPIPYLCAYTYTLFVCTQTYTGTQLWRSGGDATLL